MSPRLYSPEKCSIGSPRVHYDWIEKDTVVVDPMGALESPQGLRGNVQVDLPAERQQIKVTFQGTLLFTVKSDSQTQSETISFDSFANCTPQQVAAATYYLLGFLQRHDILPACGSPDLDSILMRLMLAMNGLSL